MPARLSNEQHPQAEREAWNRERDWARPSTDREGCLLTFCSGSLSSAGKAQLLHMAGSPSCPGPLQLPSSSLLCHSPAQPQPHWLFCLWSGRWLKSQPSSLCIFYSSCPSWKGTPLLALPLSPHTGSFKCSRKEFSPWQALLTNQRPLGSSLLKGQEDFFLYSVTSCTLKKTNCTFLWNCRFSKSFKRFQAAQSKSQPRIWAF